MFVEDRETHIRERITDIKGDFLSENISPQIINTEFI
jgi:hypothetical protein